LSEETRNRMREASLLACGRKLLSIESRLKCAVNVRPVTVTNLDGSNLR